LKRLDCSAMLGVLCCVQHGRRERRIPWSSLATVRRECRATSLDLSHLQTRGCDTDGCPMTGDGAMASAQRISAESKVLGLASDSPAWPADIVSMADARDILPMSQSEAVGARIGDLETRTLFQFGTILESSASLANTLVRAG
jgi:hypothetical protein